MRLLQFSPDLMQFITFYAGLLQFITICIIIYITMYPNIYYILLYIFLSFFLFGVSLSILQLDLFTAFLWLIECSVIFVFLLLLFYLNVKGIFIQTNIDVYKNFIVFSFIVYFIVILPSILPS